MEQVESKSEVCDKCGGDYFIGDWPYCNGDGDHKRGSFGFDPFTPYVDPHILPNGRDIGPAANGEIMRGTKIESREHRKAIMKQHGLHWKGRKIGNGRTEF